MALDFLFCPAHSIRIKQALLFKNLTHPDLSRGGSAINYHPFKEHLDLPGGRSTEVMKPIYFDSNLNLDAGSCISTRFEILPISALFPNLGVQR